MGMEIRDFGVNIPGLTLTFPLLLIILNVACFPVESGIMQNGLLNDVCFVAFGWQKNQNSFFFF